MDARENGEERKKTVRSGAPFKFIRKLLPANQGRRAGLLRGCANVHTYDCTHTMLGPFERSLLSGWLPHLHFPSVPPRGETREIIVASIVIIVVVVVAGRSVIAYNGRLADRRARDTRGTVAAASRAVSRAVSRSTANGRPRARHTRAPGALSLRPPRCARCPVCCRTPTNTRGRLGVAHTVACSAMGIRAAYSRAIHTMPPRRSRRPLISLSFALVTPAPFSPFGSHSARFVPLGSTSLLIVPLCTFSRTRCVPGTRASARRRSPAETHISRRGQDHRRQKIGYSRGVTIPDAWT